MNQFVLLKLILFIALTVSPSLITAQTFEGKIEVTEGRSHTVFLKNTYRDVLARSNVINVSWESNSSDISITKFNKESCEFKALHPTAKAILYYNCSFRLDGWYQTYNFYYEVEVKSSVVHVTKVYVYPSELTLEVDARKKLSVEVYPEYADNRNVTWYSSDPAVAHVSSYTGMVTGLTKGTAKVWAYADDNGIGDYCYVTVKDPIPEVPVKSIDILEENLTLKVGEYVQLNVSVLPDNATNKTVNWSSGNSAIATVDKNGYVKAVGKGVATIKAISSDDSKIFDTVSITVLSEEDYYVIGENVNGKRWSLAEEDAKFISQGNGLYKWRGEVLGPDFRINDGTWNVSYGGPHLILGEKCYLEPKIGSANITFGNTPTAEIINPEITFDVNDLSIIVDGELSNGVSLVTYGKSISIVNGKINISGLELSDGIILCNIVGEVIGNYKSETGNISIEPGPGIYILRINNNTIKVVVK
ncbi:MAG: Ig-like domain-containing protein [Muribaculaceae bacterium]|nr:Ig-like domain-containing protein [Muribaculaceae bacterium]